MKFYPDDREKVDKLRFYSNKKDRSMVVKNNWLIGGRGFGKTYSTKLDILRDFQAHSNTFFWSRTTDRQLSNILDPVQFFGRIRPDHLRSLEIEKYDIRNQVCYINNKRAGYLLSVSTFYNNKGADYDCTNGVWDEFIKADGERPVNKKFDKFMDLCQSVLRDNKRARVVGLSNSTNQYDEVLHHYNWDKSHGFGIYLYRDQNALIHYIAPSATFVEAQKSSISYEGMSEFQKKMTFGNEFTDHDVYEALEKARYLFTIMCYEDEYISIYEAKGKLYCKRGYPKKYLMRSVNPTFVNAVVQRVTSTEKRALISSYDRGKIGFLDGYARTLFQEQFCS